MTISYEMVHLYNWYYIFVILKCYNSPIGLDSVVVGGLAPVVVGGSVFPFAHPMDVRMSIKHKNVSTMLYVFG